MDHEHGDHPAQQRHVAEDAQHAAADLRESPPATGRRGRQTRRRCKQNRSLRPPEAPARRPRRRPHRRRAPGQHGPSGNQERAAELADGADNERPRRKGGQEVAVQRRGFAADRRKESGRRKGRRAERPSAPTTRRFVPEEGEREKEGASKAHLAERYRLQHVEEDEADRTRKRRADAGTWGDRKGSRLVLEASGRRAGEDEVLGQDGTCGKY